MSNLSKFTTPKFEYDWNLIEDSMDRQAAKSAVMSYKATHEALRNKADEIIKTDNVAKARCVYALKESLKHGQFYEVCQQALGLTGATASALASTGKLLQQGSHSDDALELMKQMEPRAANQFIKSDDESKSIHVERFKSTGHIPSRRDFNEPYVAPKKTMNPYVSEDQSNSISPTTSDDEAGRRLAANKIRPVHFLGWLNSQLASKQTVSDDMKEELSNLAFQLQRLNINA